VHVARRDLDPLLDSGGYVGESLVSFLSEERQRLESRGTKAEELVDGEDRELDVAASQRRESLGAATRLHEAKACALRRRLDPSRDEVARGANVGAERNRVRTRGRTIERIAKFRDVSTLARCDDEMALTGAGDRSEGLRAVRRLAGAFGRQHRLVEEEDRVAVGRRVHHPPAADRATGAVDVDDGETLRKKLVVLDGLLEDTSEGVRAAAGSERHDETDGTSGVDRRSRRRLA